MSATNRKRATRGSKNQVILTPAMHGPVGDLTKGYVLNLNCDVVMIQEKLNKLLRTYYLHPFRGELKADGKVDPYTLQLIQHFQRKAHIPGAEAMYIRIDPNGRTLEKLGELVHEIEITTAGEIYKGKFDKPAFIQGYRHIVPKGEVSETSVAGLTKLLTYLEEDAEVTDLRWMAYMIATVRKEAGANFLPIQEKGKGGNHQGKNTKGKDDYGREVIVSQQGNHIILDFVSDPTIVINQSGKEIKFAPLTKETAQKPPKDPSLFAIRVDQEARQERAKTGSKMVYFGRGYVQTTWWYGFVKVGQRFGLGNSLLFDPDLLARDHDLAYKAMSAGMREGWISGVSLAKYIQGAKCDYLGARWVINSQDDAPEIKKLAIKIHDLLHQCKINLL